MKTRSLAQWGWLFLLMLVVCLPRVTIDAYLPSLPAMADALHGTDAQLQLTLTLYMVGYALSMLVSGPLSDRYGRRPVLLGGLCLYVVASAACALSTSIPALIAARVFQALGGCTGTVIGRVIVRERFPAATQATMLGHISAGMALSPVVAPLAGSAIAEWLGWRGVFGWLAAGGLVATAMVLRYLPETRARDAVPQAGPGLLRIYAGLLRERRFLRYSLAISFVYCTYYPFIAESSTLFQRQIGVSGPVYAAIFGVTVLGYLIGSSAFARTSRRWSADAVIAVAAAVNLAGAVVLWIGGAVAPMTVTALVVPMFVVMIAVGIAIPACQFAVMQPYTKIAGTASGLFFFIQMAISAACGGVLAWLSDGTAHPMIVVTVGASVAFLAVVVGFRERSVAGHARFATGRRSAAER
ncbi:MAG: multidrug effflux MFS transporter [Burkholderia sp.]|jgi:DHA1 family bicyclomycin/chloramphenicol resistance-like MFS transporter|uniref:multidrug effflux MFS transporter n=2 Tax=Burkholderiaceae TaxID=119060 RepID=UPI001CF3320C|nr:MULTISPECIES: multidrug effflux MFS transporter [Burkholderia]MCA3776333.1 multidrug effflux MFS transporter [Burkholderia sp.]MCA3789252.1 multidrug effflux MFS transporter [Burkholderia sp.]MCA3790852.1 multidrug effflux MFS transporter [Burkholderia sp.]MCA3803420.1 multidrug effflux MFS transporter [Burkholderia sp.]MCA3813247.1 multidrug effflux MFS transporter [Burkholderia sp.]